MRRSITFLCLAAALSLSAPAPAAPLEPSAVADESALATWMFPTERPRHSRWFFAGAYRDAVAGGRTVTTAFAVKGHCEVVREDGETVTRCHGRGVGGKVRPGAFEVDPALREATLALPDGDALYVLTWHADATPPSGYVGSESCDAGTGQGAGFMRHATAGGDLFGRRLDHDGIDHAVLSRGGMLTECPGTERLARRVAAGKTVTVVYR